MHTDVIHGGDIYRNEVKYDFSVNVNPFGMPDSVRSELQNAVNCCEQYPDIKAQKLVEAVSEMEGVLPNHVLCGNGASELFLAIVHAIQPRDIIIPVPSFYGYQRVAEAVSTQVHYYFMKEKNGFCLDRGIIEEIENMEIKGSGILFLANPNNPVGNQVEASLLDEIVLAAKKKNIFVVIDECFLDFSEENGFWKKHCFKDYEHVIVVRAFTKIYAIPGVRIGYLLIGNEQLKERIQIQLPEWNVSTFAQKAGCAAAKEKEYREKTIEYVKQEREYLTKSLQALGIEVYPSNTNYLFLKDNDHLYEMLLKQKILIRDCSNYIGLTDGYYRIAVRTREMNDTLIAAIKKVKERK